MNTALKLHEICIRLDHIESAGSWLARSLVYTDNAAAQTGTLVTVLSEDIRERLIELVTELEKQMLITQKPDLII